MTEEQKQKRNRRQNEWTAERYERQTVTLLNGTKERIKALGETSINGYINRLISEDLERREQTPKT